MKIFKRVLLGIALAFVCVFTLASCSKVSQSYADKINDAAKDGEYVSIGDARDALGDECIELTVLNTGVLAAVKGYNKDNYKEKLDAADENTKFEYIVIYVAAGNCTGATYGSGSAAEVKAAMSKTSK